MHVNARKCRDVFVNEMELTCWMIDTMNRTRFNPLQRQEKTAWLSCKEMSAYRTPCAPVKLPSGFKCHNWHETCWWERAMYLLCALLPSCPHLILPLSTPCPPLAPNLLFILLSFSSLLFILLPFFFFEWGAVVCCASLLIFSVQGWFALGHRSVLAFFLSSSISPFLFILLFSSFTF